jgi:hypothetical protein
MVNVTHTDKLGRVAEDLVVIKLSSLFEDCIVSQVTNNQLHDVEIRKSDEKLTERICKIQVKATNSKQTRGAREAYFITIHHGAGMGSGKKENYKRGDVDFFIFYVFPPAAHYVIPDEAIRGSLGTTLYAGLPKPHGAKYEKYLDAWPLITDFLGLPAKEEKTINNTLHSTLDRTLAKF